MSIYICDTCGEYRDNDEIPCYEYGRDEDHHLRCEPCEDAAVEKRESAEDFTGYGSQEGDCYRDDERGIFERNARGLS